MPSSLALTPGSPPVNYPFNPEIGDLFIKLHALFRLDPTFCFPTDSTFLAWQLRTPDGVRLLYLGSNDIAFPRDCVLRSALEGYLSALGVHLLIELPPLLSNGEPSLAVVVASHGPFEIRVFHTDVTMALLTVTLELLNAVNNPADDDQPLLGM